MLTRAAGVPIYHPLIARTRGGAATSVHPCGGKETIHALLSSIRAAHVRRGLAVAGLLLPQSLLPSAAVLALPLVLLLALLPFLLRPRVLLLFAYRASRPADRSAPSADAPADALGGA
jgi:hypothetical protein